MAQGEVERKLVAILAADVVGYSRLMEADEAATLTAMKAQRRELWTPTTEKHGGRVVGTAGDRLLVELIDQVAARQVVSPTGCKIPHSDDWSTVGW